MVFVWVGYYGLNGKSNMANLNEIADLVAGRLNDPLNEVLKEQIKFAVKYYRAFLIRRDITKNGMSNEFLQSIKVKLQRADKADSCIASLNCPILRSVNKIPNPIRLNSDEAFKFVGSVGRQKSFTYTRLEELPFTNYLEFNTDEIRYEWMNGYLYIFNNLKLKYAELVAPYANPNKVKDDCDDIPCFNDDMEFPLGDDLLQTIITGLLSGEFKLRAIEDGQVEIEEDGQ